MLDATVGERRRTINLLVQTPDQADFDRLEDGQVILRQRDDEDELWAQTREKLEHFAIQNCQPRREKNLSILQSRIVSPDDKNKR